MSWRMKPARNSSRWLAASASAGSSLSVGMCSCDQRMSVPCLAGDSIEKQVGRHIAGRPHRVRLARSAAETATYCRRVESALIRRRELSLPSARSLLLTVLGEYVRPAGEPVWTATLVNALGVLGVTEKAARQALARTASDGWLTSTRHGRRARWELTQAGRRLLTDGAHRIYSFGQGRTGWDGRWLVLVTSASDAVHDHRRGLRTRLTWAGFDALPGGVWVSTDPDRESEANRILDELGLSETCLS